MHRVRTERHPTGEDIAAVEELLQRARRADGRPPLSDQLAVDLAAGGGDGFVAIIADGDGPHPVGYAQLSRGNEAHTLELVISPDRRDAATELGHCLIDAAIAALADTGGGVVDWWVAEPSAAERELAESTGFSLDRTLYRMERSLPTGRRATIATRPFVPGADDEQWLAVNNRAFAAHREQGGWTVDTLHRRVAEPWFDAAGFRVHERDGRMAGFCWTKVHPAEDSDGHPVGEIYVIAVDPDFHGLGLGTELTLAGLDHLGDAGITSALLYVAADNAAAVAMYERLGFAIAATNVAFAREVAERRP